MFSHDTVPRPARRAPADWVGRMVDRVAGLKDQVKDGVVEVVGRTAAEAAEVAVRRVFRLAAPVPARPAWDGRDWPPDDPDDGWGAGRPGGRGSASAGPLAAGGADPLRTTARWPWCAVAVAALHGLVGWVRRSAVGPIRRVLGAVVGALLLLLD